MFSFTTSARWVVSTVVGSTTVQLRHPRLLGQPGRDPAGRQPEGRLRRAFAGQCRGLIAGADRQHHQRAKFARSGGDLLQREHVGVGLKLHVVLDAHRRQHEAEFRRQRPAQPLDLFRQMFRWPPPARSSSP